MDKNFNAFFECAVNENNKNYGKFTARMGELYKKDDIRSPFARDYTRILHCSAYRRLKHKTQVFYNIESDHICTRMEHVSHVESVSYTIAKYLGLNDELTKAIACGHDLGHAPFGHSGEEIIAELTKEYLGEPFWHEKNSLYMVDNVELLPDDNDVYRNLTLSYAVRDGIVAHCGEVDSSAFFPRSEFIDLARFTKGKYSPVTFEGCVVKLSDKIAYVGRDIEDAISLGFLGEKDVRELNDIIKLGGGTAVNTSNIISCLIKDVCANSTPETGISLSEGMAETLKKVKSFNYERIYSNARLEPFTKYAKLVINEIFYLLLSLYEEGRVIERLNEEKNKYRVIVKDFIGYIEKYTGQSAKYQNVKIYKDIDDKKVYIRAIIDYISGMTDRYAVEMFNDLITY